MEDDRVKERRVKEGCVKELFVKGRGRLQWVDQLCGDGRRLAHNIMRCS